MTVPSTLKELGNEMGLDLSTMLIPSSQVSGNLGGGTDNTPTYTIYKTGANFAARANMAGLTDVAANADAAAVLQSAMDNINGSTTPRGLIIFAPNTTFTWSSVPVIRRTYASGGSDDNKWLRILGSGGSVIQLTATGYKFFKYNRVADYDGFCGVEVGHFTVDGTGVSTVDVSVFGTRGDSLGSLQRCDVRRLYIHDIDASLPTFNSASGRYAAFIWLEVRHPAPSEGTQSQITDVTVERCRVNGGNTACALAGIVDGGTAFFKGTNIFMDRIRISDLYFESNIAAGSLSTYPASSLIQVGGIAFGERCVIERCWLSGSPDDGIEFNNFRRGIVRDTHMRKVRGGGFTPVQFNYVNGVNNLEAQTQEIIFENCFYEHIGGMESDSTDRAFLVHGFGVAGADSGTIIFRNCVSYCSAKIGDTCAQLGGAFVVPNQIASNVDRIILEGCTFDVWYDCNTPSSDTRPVWLDTMGRECIIRDLNIIHRGAQVSGVYFIKSMYLNGQSKARLDLDGVTVQDLTTGRGNGQTYLAYIGDAASSDLGGTIRRLTQLSATSDTTPRGIWVGPSSSLTLRKLLIEDCDFTRLTGDSGHVFFQTAGQNEAPVFIRNLKGRVDPPAEIAFTPGATTVAAQYLGHYEGLMTLTGGTVTAISVSTDNATYRQIGTTTPASFYVDHGHWVKLTYTVVPTCAVIPRR